MSLDVVELSGSELSGSLSRSENELMSKSEKTLSSAQALLLSEILMFSSSEKYVTQKMLAEQSLSKITQQDGKVHSQCVSRKEFRKLKDEVRRLKQKLVSLTEPSSTESEQKATSTSSVLKSPQSFSSSSAEESDTYNGFTLHDLKDSICHTDKLRNGSTSVGEVYKAFQHDPVLRACFPLVYKLLYFAMILPSSTAVVERSFLSWETL
ncbi:hypothetical protein ACF0H5_010018 [Mactra antiquata]